MPYDRSDRLTVRRIDGCGVLVSDLNIHTERLSLMVIWPPARYAVHSSAPFPLAAAAQIADVGDADGQWLGLPVAALSKPPDLSAVDMECSADSVGLVPYEQPVYVLANRLHEVLSRSVRYLEGRP